MRTRGIRPQANHKNRQQRAVIFPTLNYCKGCSVSSGGCVDGGRGGVFCVAADFAGVWAFVFVHPEQLAG